VEFEVITGEVYPEIVAELARPETERKQRVAERALEIIATGTWCRLFEEDVWRLSAGDGIHYVDVPAPLLNLRSRGAGSLPDEIKLVAFQKLVALLDPEIPVSYS
jgi:hypothetical protein